MSDREARRRARLEFGGGDHVKEICRDVRGTRWVEEIVSDVRFTVRLLWKERWFSAAAVIALTLGLGVASMVVTLINGYYFRGLPVDEPERIFSLNMSLNMRDQDGRDNGLSYQDYQDFRMASRSFSELGAFTSANMTLSDKGEAPDSIDGTYVSARVFDILAERPILGRGFSVADDRAGAPPVVVLGYRLWTGRYGADPTIIGRSVSVNQVPSTVIGVMRDGFEFPFRQAMWQPLMSVPGIAALGREVRILEVFGQLASGIAPAQAREEIASLATALAEEHPETNSGSRPTLVPFTERQIGRLADAQPPQLLIAVAAIVLLIACANVANLLLARSASRSRELAIRTSVGATRWRIVRQLLVESIVLALPSGGLGLWLSRFGVRYVSDAFGRNVPYWMEFTVDGTVLLALLVLCLTASILFGLAPALSVSRTDITGAMKEGGRTGIAPRSRRWTHALLTVELATALILLAGAGLLARSFLALYQADRVIDASSVLTAQLSLPEDRYPTPESRSAFYQRLDDRLMDTPGISIATVASARPFVGGARRRLSVVGNQAVGADQLPTVLTVTVGPRYFDTLGLRLLRGRAFTARDGTPGYEVAIVNQRFVELHFPGEDAVGKRVQLFASGAEAATEPSLTIIGVAPTVRQRVAGAPGPVVYLPIATYGNADAALIVGRLSDPPAATPMLRGELASLDPDVLLFNVRPLDDLLADSRLQHRLLGTVLPVFAGIALLLAVIGVYAVTAYAVFQSTHEIGVRIALGARPRHVVGHFVRRALTPLVCGLLIGLAGAIGVGRLLRGALIQTEPSDPLTLVFVVILLVVVALAACYFPSRRASRVDPLVVLRIE